MRDLGEAGEAAFSAWCAISGITANKSIKDRHGWDVFIEFESELDPCDAFEMHEPLIECKVQIKSTDARKRALPVTLSNLKAMATTPIPSFYVLLEFDESEAPVRAFVLHVGDDLISEILSRIRKSTRRNPTNNLHKKTMQLKFPSNTEVVPLSAANIKLAIIKAIGKSAASYSKKKLSFLASSGFEEKSHVVNFTLEGAENFEEFVKMQLGYSGKTEVQNISSHVTRFGVSNENLLFRSETAILQITHVSPDGRGFIEFKDRATGLNLSFPMELFRGGLASWIPEHHKKLRISTDRLDIQISRQLKKLLINFNFNADVPYEVSEQIKFYKFCSMLDKPENVSVNIIMDGHSLKGKLNNENSVTMEHEDYSMVITTLKSLQSIQSHFEFHGALHISLTELQNNKKLILNYAKILRPDTSEITFRLNIPESMQSEKNVECIHVIAFTLANISFLEVIVLKGTLEHADGHTYTLDVQGVQSLYRTTSIHQETKMHLKSDVQSTAANYTSDAPIIDLTEDFILNSDYFKEGQANSISRQEQK
ncbi:hypothetical protein C9I50_00465 [Pseudomonas prosekii]|uniref:hypothetical protein n=1 Tax=Pseudomonas prosekii TaxID=1148509 RepID=UPI000D619661|nr:hypothetical protein [Pseudomonas prosekii]PWE46189.1 hypothetical protein C9I50_00465 [Pseudomonas prosekii]